MSPSIAAASEMRGAIIVLNAGSSSLKFSVYSAGDDRQPEAQFRGQVEGLGTRPRFRAYEADGTAAEDDSYSLGDLRDHDGALKLLSAWLDSRLAGTKIEAVGHRVVHGGADFDRPLRITPELLARLEALVPLAPLHQPHNLAAIRAVAMRYPELPQIACFDTAFHRSHPALADRFALPEELYREGIRRYGFHGISYEYIAQALPQVAPEVAGGRVIVAHLGSGASMCALHAGRSIDSTMGFTALDGLPMGTRSGALDPGVPLYLMAAKGYDAKALERLLYYDCGLQGLSGISNDVRDLQASGDPRAKLALDYFVHRIHRELGALTAVLKGLDALVFTAGIGEHAAEIRAAVCAEASWLGIELDPAANAAHDPCITRPGCAVSAWVIPTDEEKMIARHTQQVLDR